MLQTAFILCIESAVSKLVSTDTVTASALKKIEGKVIEIIITDTPIHIFLLPHMAGFEIQQSVEHPSDTLLSGSIENFRKLMTSNNKSEQFFGNGIEISGDTQLAAKLQRIIYNAQIDWQALTANLTGDIIAHQLAQITKTATKQINLTKHSFELNLAEYLQEEVRHLPARVEVKGFISDIDQISQSIDRIEARINLLSST